MERMWEKYIHNLIRVAWFGLVVLILYFLFAKGIFYIMPFFVAAIITLLIENQVSFLERKAKAPRTLATLIVLLVFVVLFGTILVFLTSRIITEMVKFSASIPSNESIVGFIQGLLNSGQGIYDALPQEVVQLIDENLRKNLDEIVKTVTGYITTTLKAAVTTIVNIVTSLPNLFIFFLVTFMATFFMTKDRRRITDFIKRQIPYGWQIKIKSLQTDLLVALIGFIKAQAALISITFALLLIGYTLIGLDYALFLALLTAFLDALPILGTGTVLVPWAVINIFLQNYPMAIKLLILYGVILTVRQILEPKVLGKGLGLHPLVTLMSMHIGLQLLGVGGLLLGPIIVIVLKALQKAKILPAWK